MALQYTFQTRTRLAPTEALPIVGHEVGGRVVDGTEIQRDGMQVVFEALARRDGRSTGEAIGFAPACRWRSISSTRATTPSGGRTWPG
ncbi:hypothetical protein [Polymorphospora rubra]|uniref:Uncharacterized protein n=1 Tax=Polymorphospora rubra TaxID=338584 RepID=A0A810MT62_9ACTN|nr:hypothetical protein [Polymorphospora rubra]BCJ64231.1 hypothetical protein Prubr_12520 [Polymorphospora rubra]